MHDDDLHDDCQPSGVCSECGCECDSYGVNLGCTEDAWCQVSPCCECTVVSAEAFMISTLKEARAAITLGLLCQGDSLERASANVTVGRIDRVLERKVSA